MAAEAPPTNPSYSSYQRLPSMVLGFHGCDRRIGEAVLSGKTRHLKHSSNPHDWLGDGMYFWENDPLRAMEWAVEAKNKPALTKGRIKEPFVVGAVIELGLCLNLMSRECLDELAIAHDLLVSTVKKAGGPMPENKGREGALRFLDRAVVETLHESRKLRSEPEALPQYDTVRAAFREGVELYPGAGFEKKSHIQIAVRSEVCIKGYFRPFVDSVR